MSQSCTCLVPKFHFSCLRAVLHSLIAVLFAIDVAIPPHAQTNAVRSAVLSGPLLRVRALMECKMTASVVVLEAIRGHR